MVGDLEFNDSDEVLFDNCSFNSSVHINHGRFDANDDEGHYSASRIAYTAIFSDTCTVSELHLSGIYGEETPLSILNIESIKLKKFTISPIF